jgi:hypothetical protein
MTSVGEVTAEERREKFLCTQPESNWRPLAHETRMVPQDHFQCTFTYVCKCATSSSNSPLFPLFKWSNKGPFRQTYKSVVQPAIQGSVLHVTYKFEVNLPCTAGSTTRSKTESVGQNSDVHGRQARLKKLAGNSNWFGLCAFV